MIHGRTGVLATLFALGLFISGCAGNTTTVTDVQSGEQAARDFSDILVVAASRNPRVRSAVGQALADEMNRRGITATYLEDDEALTWSDPAELRRLLLNIATSGQHDGVLVVSLVDARHHTRYEPETITYIPDSQDIGPAASITYMERSVRPESFERSSEYVIQSTLYDAASGRPVWRVISSTVDPTSLEKDASDFATVIVNALEAPAKQGQQ